MNSDNGASGASRDGAGRRAGRRASLGTGTGGAGRRAAGRGTGSGFAGGGGTAGGPGAGGSGMRLRLARQARGFSQLQLAGMASVSRQAVSAVEAGHSDPSLRVALAVARALGTTVEQLFGPGEPPPPVDAGPVAPRGQDGAGVTLAPLGEALVALPLAGATAAGAGFLPAGGVAADPGPGHAWHPRSDPGRARPQRSGHRRASPRTGRWAAPPAGTAGPADRPAAADAGGGRSCDPAMPLIETPLALLDPPIAFTWWPCGSQEALELAADQLVHVAGAHLRGASGEYNTGPARELLRRQGADVVGFCSWREGLVLRTDLAGQVAGLGDVVRRGLRLVNRETGSEARRVLDRELARLGIGAVQISGYGTQATGHLQVAASIAAGLADVGVASEPAALAFGLAFVPLAAEHFDLVIPAEQVGGREVQGLLKVLSSRWLLDQLASLPGYDPARCGEHVASL